ncbi:selenocysteine-specific translation elongation factor [Corynebacterium poyangense]|uniref:Selenocysteine-specific elongation factor n=1 Tax=Corynebacterium poyangense TaxID=2684405 RepID=A0A7H0SN51_9CORY|nr:selenocysteine-specific translation elongation factor [Corynebacterium poyangense]QNQ89976.1 selenocysteine-specific translation elongation factor [Corynebacterium poyangense]
MTVIATAGHVDHGKSTLVKALTGMEPDRWGEEKQRGLTIDLGFGWTRLPSGRDLAFVDVPGHERFLSNMLAGVGPISVVCLVIAADEGWQEQTTDHCAALEALGIQHGVIALTRCDRASQPRQKEVVLEVRRRLAGTSLEHFPVVPVSAQAGEGLDQLRRVLDLVIDQAEEFTRDRKSIDRVRFWVDRSFSITGAGTVVTGTLTAGSLSLGQELSWIDSEGRQQQLSIRGLHSENKAQQTIVPETRAAINLRGVTSTEIHRGDVLLSPGQWHLSSQIDVRWEPCKLAVGTDFEDTPGTIIAHCGTRSVETWVRPLNNHYARLTFPQVFPWSIGDRIILRLPGNHAVWAGVSVLDIAPPELHRRGEAKARARFLESLPQQPRIENYLSVQGIMACEDLKKMGIHIPDPLPRGVVSSGGYVLSEQKIEEWAQTLKEMIKTLPPLSPGITLAAARHALSAPEDSQVLVAAAAAGLEYHDGVMREPGQQVDLGDAEESILTLEQWLTQDPFLAPDAKELAELRLTPKHLAAAERAGRIIRLGEDKSVILLPTAPDLAVRKLRDYGEKFTLSQARRILDTTRRIAVPLLEYLDSQKLTRRIDNQHRIVY